MTFVIRHKKHLTIKTPSSKDASKDTVLTKQLVRIVRIDDQFQKLLDVIPRSNEAYTAIAEARHQLFVGCQYLLGCKIDKFCGIGGNNGRGGCS
jgi:hypothetical protein